jgi:murein DD-endopeptidase MepM/ murein hydrolase activator NlpD
VQDIVGNNLLNLEKLERQIKLETESQKELFEQFKIQQELVKHWPAIHPLEWNGKITGKFGRRIDPFTGFLASHKGIDISIDKGTPIYSTGDGVVVFADKSIGGYGKLIRISHSNGLETWFGHLSKIDVRKGQRIKRGQKIGEVGSSGRSTAPHLHYEIRYNNKPQNPLEYFYDEAIFPENQ